MSIKSGTVSDWDDEELDGDASQSEEALSYENPDNQNSLTSQLNTLRKGGQFCDVRLEVDAHTIDGHRAVLACASAYLFELFSADDSNTLPCHYRLENVDFKSFDILVNYAYTAKLEVPADRVRAVYKAAVLLKMHNAAQACSNFLAQRLTATNCLGTRAFANSYCDAGLTTTADNYIQDHLNDLQGSQEMKTLPCIQVDILGVEDSDLSEKTSEKNHKNLCGLVMQWAKDIGEGHSVTDLFSTQGEEEHVHKLYLTSDNQLRDCRDIDDRHISSTDEVQDYKKAKKNKRQLRQLLGEAEVLPRKTKKDKVHLTPNKQKGDKKKEKGVASRMTERQPNMEKEWKIIAMQKITERRCLCIAMLSNNLVRISINMRPMPTSTVNSDSESPSPNTSPRGSFFADKQCSLSPLARMISARCGVGAAVLNQKLVALGGYDRGECLSTAEAFDIEKNEWKAMKPMLSPRGRFDVAQLDGKLYACGGSNGLKELKSVEVYDPETDEWMSLPSMHSLRSSAGVAALNDKLYVIGGWSGQTGLAECESFDTKQKKWYRIAPLMTGRSQAGVCAYGGNVYVMGGCDKWNCINSCEMYSVADNEWMSLPNMMTARRGAGVTVFKGKLYVVGGSDGTASLTSVEIFHPETQTWMMGPNLSVPRANVGCVVMNNRLFAIGGFSGKQFLDTFEYLNAEASEWCSFVPVEEKSERVLASGKPVMCNGGSPTHLKGPKTDSSPLKASPTAANGTENGNGIPHTAIAASTS